MCGVPSLPSLQVVNPSSRKSVMVELPVHCASVRFMVLPPASLSAPPRSALFDLPTPPPSPTPSAPAADTEQLEQPAGESQQSTMPSDAESSSPTVAVAEAVAEVPQGPAQLSQRAHYATVTPLSAQDRAAASRRGAAQMVRLQQGPVANAAAAAGAGPEAPASPVGPSCRVTANGRGQTCVRLVMPTCSAMLLVVLHDEGREQERTSPSVGAPQLLRATTMPAQPHTPFTTRRATLSIRPPSSVALSPQSPPTSPPERATPAEHAEQCAVSSVSAAGGVRALAAQFEVAQSAAARGGSSGGLNKATSLQRPFTPAGQAGPVQSWGHGKPPLPPRLQMPAGDASPSPKETTPSQAASSSGSGSEFSPLKKATSEPVKGSE